MPEDALVTENGEVACVAITVAKQGCVEQIKAALEDLIAPVHAEKGFLQYDLHRDLLEPRRFVFVERWESRADFDAHCVAPHINRYLELTRDWIEYSAFYPLKLIGPQA